MSRRSLAVRPAESSTDAVVVPIVKTIYKYPVVVDDEFTIYLPEGAQVLSVDVQQDEPQMWVLVDPAAPKTKRTFRVIGTGHPIDDVAQLSVHRHVPDARWSAR